MGRGACGGMIHFGYILSHCTLDGCCVFVIQEDGLPSVTTTERSWARCARLRSAANEGRQVKWMTRSPGGEAVMLDTIDSPPVVDGAVDCLQWILQGGVARTSRVFAAMNPTSRWARIRSINKGRAHV